MNSLKRRVIPLLSETLNLNLVKYALPIGIAISEWDHYLFVRHNSLIATLFLVKMHINTSSFIFTDTIAQQVLLLFLLVEMVIITSQYISPYR